MFEKVNIPDCIVIIGLVTALILAIFLCLERTGYVHCVRASRLHRRHREVRRSSERRRKTMKVFLNPGHASGGHPNPGAVNSESGLRECDVVLAVGQSARPPMPVMPTSSCPSTAMLLKPKKPTAQKPGPAPAVTVAACWRAASRTRLSMFWIRQTGA